MPKILKVGSVNIQSDCKTTTKKRTDSSCVFTHSEKAQKVGMITKQQVKNEQIENELVLCVF